MTGARRLFHYTARHHADDIRRSGAIDRGGVPIPSDSGEEVVGIAPGFQWLTTSDDWCQGWATRLIVSCDRTECRLVVRIPILERHRLARWVAVAADFGYGAETARRFAALGSGSDPSTWYLFDGAIPYAWVTAVERRPEQGP